MISIAEISFDALHEDPEYNSFYERMRKYFEDVGIAVGSNILMAIALPTTLVSGTPRRILFGFMIANVLHWFVYVPK